MEVSDPDFLVIRGVYTPSDHIYRHILIDFCC